jgi:hypothetical protein
MSLRVQKEHMREETPQIPSRVRRITLQTLFADGSEIWVRNNTGKLTGGEAGNIVLQVGNGNMIDKVIIPPGNDPVCLTDQVTPNLLKECMDLFKVVRSNALELLDPKNAEEYYEKNQNRRKVMDAKIQKLLDQKVDAPDKKKVATSTNASINPKVGDICLKSKHAAISEQEALEGLLEQESALTADDYNYIMANGIYNAPKNWARDQLKSMSE